MAFFRHLSADSDIAIAAADADAEMGPIVSSFANKPAAGAISLRERLLSCLVRQSIRTVSEKQTARAVAELNRKWRHRSRATQFESLSAKRQLQKTASDGGGGGDQNNAEREGPAALKGVFHVRDSERRDHLGYRIG